MQFFFFCFYPFFLALCQISTHALPLPSPICHHLSVPRHLFLISSSQYSVPYRHFTISNDGTSDGAMLSSYGFPYENSLAPSLAPTLELMKCPQAMVHALTQFWARIRIFMSIPSTPWARGPASYIGKRIRFGCVGFLTFHA